MIMMSIIIYKSIDNFKYYNIGSFNYEEKDGWNIQTILKKYRLLKVIYYGKPEKNVHADSSPPYGHVSPCFST